MTDAATSLAGPASGRDPGPPLPGASAPDAAFIHEGRDGWLFLTAGSNNVIGQFRRSKRIRAALRDWTRIVVARHARCRRLGIGYLHVVVPEKLTIYDHKLDGLKVAVRLSPALRLRRGLIWHPRVRRACLDLVGLFRTHRDAEDLFFRTDSHWSLAGCRLAYRAVCAAWGARPVEDFSDRPFHDRVHAGDLGQRFDPPRSEPARHHALQRDASRIYASPIVRAREAAGVPETLHVGAHVIYRNEKPEADPRRLVLFGDSYAHFAPIMLTILLAETFREVHFLWSASIDWAYVERVRPDLVLTQVAERFMYRAPDDAFDIEAYAAERYGEELRAAGL